MLFKLFNWLVKRKKVPYALAVVLPDLIWTIVVAGAFGGFLVFKKAEFDVTGTGLIFALSLIICTIIVSLLVFLEDSGWIDFKRKKIKIKVINKNIIQGHIRSNISNQSLLEVYNSLKNINRWALERGIQYTGGTLIIVTLVEWLVSGYLKNVFIIFICGGLAILWSNIGTIVFFDLFTIPARKECKALLANKSISFKEIHYTTLKLKSRLFIFLLVILVTGILILVEPLNLNLIMYSSVLLIIITILHDSLFETFYSTLFEIKELSKNLAKGKKTSFFSGSSDKEIIDLSQSLNKTAQEITNYQQALEQEKTSLEIKVKARTKELQELTQSLDQKVKQRTKQLQDRVDELERFHKLTIGREIKMVELKKKIKELEKKQKNK